MTALEPSKAAEAAKASKGKGKDGANGQPAPTAAGEKKPTAAELKKKAKEEKAARRAQTVAGKQVDVPGPIAESSPAGPAPGAAQQQRVGGQQAPRSQQRAGGPVPAGGRNLPLRSGQKTAPSAPVLPKKEDKTVEFFRHLYKTRTTTIAGVSKDVHPAILALGLQMGNYTICGSTARLVATLQAFKRVSLCNNLVNVNPFSF